MDTGDFLDFSVEKWSVFLSYGAVFVILCKEDKISKVQHFNHYVMGFIIAIFVKVCCFLFLVFDPSKYYILLSL